jgi:hypothetical protein
MMPQEIHEITTIEFGVRAEVHALRVAIAQELNGGH